MTNKAVWKILREHFVTGDFDIEIDNDTECVKIQKVDSPREGDIEISSSTLSVHFLGFDSTDIDVLDKIVTKIDERWS